MISAPSDTRWRSMPHASIVTNTIASTSGIDNATTAPARSPRLTKLTASTMAIASHNDSMKSPIAPLTVVAWLATRIGSTPIGRSAVIRRIESSICLPSATMSPPSRMAIASAIAR